MLTKSQNDFLSAAEKKYLLVAREAPKQCVAGKITRKAAVEAVKQAENDLRNIRRNLKLSTTKDYLYKLVQGGSDV